MSKSIKEIAKIASEWWADKVANTKFDNGDDSSNGEIATCLAVMNTKSVASISKEKFINKLSHIIEEQLLKEFNIELSVDYRACRELNESAEYAGISKNNFPWKTAMWIGKNHISVSYGYRAKEEYLYANKIYWQSKINSLKSSIEKYQSDKMLSWIENDEERNTRAKERIADMEESIMEYQSNLDKAED
ncbi:hypothetical protein FDC45_15835 [Clostridium botulinum]|uniref:Uncharacterized protein n=1 Tax=Clostridium botulinum TaxID=1491 RepID=A0A846J5Z6_CLOBO|nr:hypothetical protein [Clostridium botulinum]ACA57539.1 hypothetical protein CLK_A0175 [Clostridium botulinum A3 str. Loch Maree]NFH65001.1 hypothetical protein [Clostridium botulinum]NFJ09546.1 hypothetical protein [Clostridium botulinum]NFK16515.1 hypothetical protein [Clostridium botulinum]NFM93480.1 hypothetical protein [Clostridium botulinum]